MMRTNQQIADTIWNEASSLQGDRTTNLLSVFERYQEVHGVFSSDDAFVVWLLLKSREV